MFGTTDWRKTTAVLAAAVLTVAAGCGDDDDVAEEATPVTEATAEPVESEPAPEPTDVEPVETEAVPAETEAVPVESEAAETDADTTEPETAEPEPTMGMQLCEAWGQVHEPGGVKQLLSLMTDDVVVTDTQLGADLVGHEAVRGYVTSEAFAPYDIMECGAVVEAGAWGGGSYTLSSTSEPGSGQGITAVHTTDGLVDRQVMYYTGTEERAPAPSTELVENSTGEAYCQAWDDGVDVDAVLSHLTDDVVFTASEPLVGKDAVAEFIETDFVFDDAECGDALAENGEWAVGATTFTDSDSGLTFVGVNILRIDENGLIAEHHPFYDAGA